MPDNLTRRAPPVAWLLGACAVGACAEQGEADATPAVDVDATSGEAGSTDASGSEDSDAAGVLDDTTNDVATPDVTPFGLGCGPEQPCAAEMRCLEGTCVFPCVADGECALGEGCVDHVCSLVWCDAHDDCRVGESCVDGTCISSRGQACASSVECGMRDLCIDENCVDSTTVAVPPRWTELVDDVVAAHEATLLRAGVAGYGNGGALADTDGDGDLDLFLGGDNVSGSRACLYRNVSTPGAIRFERDARLCDVDLPLVASAFAVDVERDGVDELVMLGAGIVHLVRFSPTFEEVDLLESVAPDSSARGCFAGAGVATDLDADGLVDLYVGCQIPYSDPPPWRVSGLDEAMSNLVFVQRPAGRFELATDPSWSAMQVSGISLAIGLTDVDHDGLNDVIVADDTFSAEGARRLDLYPGGVRRACAPTERCRFVTERILEGVYGFGSFMGLAVVAVEGATAPGQTDSQLVYVTDLGANRFVDLAGDPHADFARHYGVELRGVRDAPWYAWAALTDDYDRNGTDDLFVSQGALDALVPQTEGFEDSMILQAGDGTFEVITGWVRDTDGAAVSLTPWRSRGAARADLDHDGLLELVVMSDAGRPRIYREPDPDRRLWPRCTLLPRTRVVHADGAGFRVAFTSDGRPRARDIQGQTRFGQGSHLVVSEGRGHLVFPSGAEAYFDCQGEPGPVVVEEPDWIEVYGAGGWIVVRLVAPWWDGEEPPTLAVATPTDVVEVMTVAGADGLYRAAIPPGATAAMARVGGRWVGRWWPL